MTTQNDYKASSISVLKGLEAVRKRPGMYIGDTSDGSGLHHMPQEIIDNAVDEAQAGFATAVEVIINKDQSVTVIDNGRGIPVDIHEEEGVSAAEIVMTKLHAGGKFNQNSYKVAGGLHGVGAAVVNALSEWMKVEVIRDGGKYEIEFRRGATVEPLKRIGDAEGQGTIVTYLADKKIFGDIVLDGERISKRIQELACLNPGIRFIFKDLRPEEPIIHDWVYHNGVSDLLNLFIAKKETMFPEPIRFSGTHEVIVKDPTGETHNALAIVDVALNWVNEDTTPHIYAYTNNIFQKEGGTHVQGARIALSNAFRSLINKNMTMKKKLPEITVDDLSEGISLVVSIKIPEPSFSSQTKEKLTSSEAQKAVGAITSESIQEWIDRNPIPSKLIIDRVVEAAEARIAAREASKRSRDKKRKDTMDQACIPGKLTDCVSNNPEECEVFLVEGDSAGGTAKQGRDRNTQAILPLKGKILNTEDTKLSKILKSAEVGTIIRALGIGGLGPKFDMDGLRYHKIVIMTDADVDGSHIKTLLLTLFYRHMRPLVEHGHIYVAQPPLYAIRRGKEITYILDDNEFDNYLLNRVVSHGYKLEWIDENGKKSFVEKEALKDLAVRVNSLNNALTAYLRLQKWPELQENLICADLMNSDAFDSENIESAVSYFIDHIKEVYPENIWTIKNINKEDGEFTISWRRRGVSREATFSRSMLNDKLLQNILTHPDYDIISFFQNELKSRLVKDDTSYPILNISGFMKAISEIGRQGIDSIGRFKGLGEMNDTELWETTLNPENRVLLKVEVKDFEEADRVFSDLMGSDSKPRKQRFMASIGALENTIEDADDIEESENVSTETDDED